jgi:ribosomal protein S18 acetylase RimI-like enzyme
MQNQTVVTADPEDNAKAIACLVTAFSSDPFIRWMFPNARQYLEYFPLVLKHFVGGAIEHGSAYRSEDFRAAAFWLPPGVSPDEDALGGVIQEGVAAALQPEVFGVLEQVGEGHPQEAHWYLPAMGVDSLCQGQGYGSALLAQSLQPCDRGHVAAYLESTNPANIPLYQRCGFEVIGDIQAGTSPVITRMQRAAR